MAIQDVSQIGRRDFLKQTFLGSAALSGAPLFFIPRFRGPLDEVPVYHPHIDPCRTVGLHDPEMTSKENADSPWRVQDLLVNGDRVAKNIDRLAMALTQEKKPGDAWKAVFIKPPKKSWSEVTVAIKTNNIAQQHTRSGVMAKICKVLTEQMEIKAENITIYDACHGADMARKTPFVGLPEGCHVAARWGGFEGETVIAGPWKKEGEKVKCLKPLAEGEVDILVNIALCKGHSPNYGGFTMCCKNHLGTFDPRWAHADAGRTEYLLAINQSPLILGELDETKKKIAFPRQQLCLIDALWASEKGPMGNSSAQPNRLYMGTFAPVLDYQVALALRKEIMGWPINQPVVDRFLDDFNLSQDSLPKGGIIDPLKTV